MHPITLFTVLLLLLGPTPNGGHSASGGTVYLPLTAASQALRLEPVAGIPENVSDLAHDGDGRLYAAVLDGLVYRLYPDGRAAPRLLLDIRHLIEIDSGEQGLLGLAFHPDFAVNRYFYVYYTAESIDPVAPAVLARFTAGPGDVAADPASELRLLTILHPMPLHYGGALRFGPDGYLYVASGDGFFARPGLDSPSPPNAQNGDNLLGKLLRLDVGGVGPPGGVGSPGGVGPPGGAPYAIPPDNPYAADDGVRDEIWLMGLRNPWRFSFDRLTGDLYVADVGLANWEEVNVIPAGTGGLNLGWPCFEGYATGPEDDGCGPPGDYVFPRHAYDHGDGRCAVTGGYVYRGRDLPWLNGRYLFADFCSGEVWSLWGAGDAVQVATLGIFPGRFWSTFGEDQNGELYLAGLAGPPAVFRLRP